MSESFGLDTRIENYSGKRSIGLYSWDFECLLAAIDHALKDGKEYPDKTFKDELEMLVEEAYAKVLDLIDGANGPVGTMELTSENIRALNRFGSSLLPDEKIEFLNSRGADGNVVYLDTYRRKQLERSRLWLGHLTAPRCVQTVARLLRPPNLVSLGRRAGRRSCRLARPGRFRSCPAATRRRTA